MTGLGWILARYDVDVLDYDTKQAVVDSASLNKRVDIEFDYSRKEVEGKQTGTVRPH